MMYWVKFIRKYVLRFFDNLFELKDFILTDEIFEIFREMYPRDGDKTARFFRSVLFEEDNSFSEEWERAVKKFVDIIQSIGSSGKKAVIVGDKDTDGILSASIVYHALSFLGFEIVDIFSTNNRKSPITSLLNNTDFSDDVLFVITDVGSLDFLASEFGNRKIVVIDHHPVSQEGFIEKSENQILINFGSMKEGLIGDLPAGALTLLVFSDVLSSIMGEEESYRFFTENVLLGASSVISDVAPLSGLNIGLIYSAMVRLWDISSMNFLYPREFFQFVAFNVSPSVNSWGRIFMKDADILHIPQILNERDILDIQKTVYGRSFYESYRSMVSEALIRGEVEKIGDSGLLVILPSEFVNVKGLVANTLLKEGIDYVVSVADRDNVISGSVRSLLPIKNIFQRLYSDYGEVGGHNQAFGFTLNMALSDFVNILKEKMVYEDLMHEEVVIPVDLLFKFGRESMGMYILGGDIIPSPTYRVVDIENLSLKIGKHYGDRIKILLYKDGYESPLQIWTKNGKKTEDALLWEFMNKEYIRVKRAYSLNYIAVFEEVI